MFRFPIISCTPYLDKIPELKRLAMVVEWNEWHPGWTTLVHTNAVLSNLDLITNALVGVRVRGILAKRVDNHTIHELLQIAALLHDITKPEHLEIHKDGTTLCPGHEETGAIKVTEILSSIGDHTGKEIQFVSEVIRWHGVPHKLFGLDSNDYLPKCRDFQKEVANEYVYTATIVHAFADTMNSRENETCYPKYQARMQRYARFIAE